MKNWILFGLTLSLSLPVLADKVNLRQDILEEIERTGALEDVRVYVSKTVLIERKSALQKESDIDSSVNRTLKQNILKETISKKIRGKIIAVEGDYTTRADTSENLVNGLKTIYVTFDPKCEKKDCAFAFRLNGKLNYRSRGYNLEELDGNFGLAKLPEVKSMDVTRVSYDKLFGKTNLGISDMRAYGNVSYTAGNGSRVNLQVDLEELRQFQIEKKKYEGF